MQGEVIAGRYELLELVGKGGMSSVYKAHDRLLDLLLISFITGALVDGSPIHVLVERSAQNQLVVTGTRGRGGFAGMLLGSTSQGVLHNSAGPAMIVPCIRDPRLSDRPDVAI